MADYDYLPVSNGSGDAALMHITASRIVGGTTITVDSTTNVPTKFVGTYGTLLATNLLDPTTKRDFKGHVIDATHIGIDAFEPGSTDSPNLATGQVVVVKPNTGWANRVAAFIKNATGFGTPENVTFAQITGTALVNAAHDHSNSAGGGQLTGAAITPGSQLADRLLNPYKFYAYQAAAFTGPPAGYTKLTFDTEAYDTGNNFATSKFTAPIAGFYWFSWMLSQSQQSGIGNGAALFKNGGLALSGSQVISGFNSVFNLNTGGSGVLQLAAGDFVEIYGVGNSLTGGPGQASTFFQGFLVSKT